jgi:class 3 adenylate cyclase
MRCFTNEPEEKYCGGCGNAIAATVSATDHAPKREPLEAERRQLTVMFCDLVGSTALAERLDPEELRDLLARYQDTCANVIRRYEGYIARYVGDGLLVYFGYPRAHEDDAQRAVRAGLEIIDAIAALNPNTEEPHIQLAVRIGISTGLVVAGNIGRGERVEQNAIVGETPNLAARLQSLAEPNSVVISASTYNLVEGIFECDALGEQQFKGISKPLRVYRARSDSGIPSQFEARATRGLSALVGREEEISLLRKRWTQASEGEGQVVLLSGEAGVGKSRIVRAFQESLTDELRNRVLYYCSPYHQNSALHPAIEQIERGLRFEKSDSPAKKLDKLETVLHDLELAPDDLVPPLASLLALPVGDRYPPLTLSPEQLKKKTLEALVAMIEAMASQNCVLMVVEDVHWSDASTLDLISLLVEQLRSTRFLLVLVFRPGFVPAWGGRAHVTALALNRLTRRDSATMIARVTKGKAVPPEIVDQIITKTDGVPLFIEELTKPYLNPISLRTLGTAMSCQDHCRHSPSRPHCRIRSWRASTASPRRKKWRNSRRRWAVRLPTSSWLPYLHLTTRRSNKHWRNWCRPNSSTGTACLPMPAMSSNTRWCRRQPSDRCSKVHSSATTSGLHAR